MSETLAIWDLYLKYFSEICDGSRPLPDGMHVQATAPMARVTELHLQVLDLGIPEFVRRCAAEEGVVIPQEACDRFRLSEILHKLEQRHETAAAPPPQSIFEVFLDSICLEESLLAYLIDLLKREDREGFRTLTRMAVNVSLDLADFRCWLANKELLGSEEEQLCVTLMDRCLDRLLAQGRSDTVAALLSGDEHAFQALCKEDAELARLPKASYSWFCRNYLDRYYPVRFVLRSNGVSLDA